jgi:NagD protein
MQDIRNKLGFICDMDGVLYHGNNLLPGAKDFVEWLKSANKSYLFLTNSSERSPRELHQKLQRMGMDVEEPHFYTSALATAAFLSSQIPHCSAYVIGEAGLLNALYDAGIAINDVSPDYVVMGETRHYNYESILRAVNLVNGGARLIGTNPDVTGPIEGGIAPACRALVSPVEMATGKHAYFVGKPNPLMMRSAKKMLGCHSADTVIIGDRMDTDIIAGIESGIDTVLVLSGVSTKETINAFPYRPNYVLNGVGDIVG